MVIRCRPCSSRSGGTRSTRVERYEALEKRVKPVLAITDMMPAMAAS
jgi:hypothetical protein